MIRWPVGRTIVLSSENWHTGVLGIVSSRLVDRYHKPVMMAAIKDGLAVGSGRSIDGFDLYGAMKKMSGCFDKFGGHYHAAGFTLPANRLEKLREDFETEAEVQLHPKDLIPSISVDSELLFRNITPDVIKQINALAPFGEGNSEPVFMARSVKVLIPGLWVKGISSCGWDRKDRRSMPSDSDLGATIPSKGPQSTFCLHPK